MIVKPHNSDRVLAKNVAQNAQDFAKQNVQKFPVHQMDFAASHWKMSKHNRELKMFSSCMQ